MSISDRDNIFIKYKPEPIILLQVLNEGYLMICVDFWSKKNSATQDWFCYHMTSSCIFPAGFCHINDIPLTPPKGYNRITFDWNDYLEETGCIAAPAELFAKVRIYFYMNIVPCVSFRR